VSTPFETITLRQEGDVAFLQFARPASNNTINGQMLAECARALAACAETSNIVVLQGNNEVFCLGADFQALADAAAPPTADAGPAAMYELWLSMTRMPCIVIAHVLGRVNAGGMGFVAASDIALAGAQAQFGLSEMLFGLYPACVMPFLVRRVGFQHANYLTLTTQPVSAQRALAIGLVDACDAQADVLLMRHLQRLRRVPKAAIRRYKNYMRHMNTSLESLKRGAVEGNLEVFSDPHNIEAIGRFVRDGVFPWERPV
jgi:polyketide biosynthesis enoyl-CoA hydratase PksH